MPHFHGAHPQYQGFVYLYYIHTIPKIIEIFELRLRELPGSKKQIGANERFKSLQKILAKALNIEDFLIGVFKVVQINFFQRLEDHLKEECKDFCVHSNV